MPTTTGSSTDARKDGQRPVTIVFYPWDEVDEAFAVLGQAASTSSADVPVLIAPDPGLNAHCRTLPSDVQRRLCRVDCEAGLAAFLNSAAATYPDHDLVVIAAPIRLSAGWLEALSAAAHADDAIALATIAWAGKLPLQLSDDRGLPAGQWSSDPAAVHTQPPTVLVPHPGGCLIRAETLGLLGEFDRSFTDPPAVLAHLAASAQEVGLRCALANPPAITPPAPIRQAPDERKRLNVLHPWLRVACEVENALDPGPLRRALVLASIRRRELSVTVDARGLSTGPGGTATYIRSLVLALAHADSVKVRVLIADEPPPELSEALLGAGAEIATYEDAATGKLTPTDIAHRPQQLFTPSDLELLRLLGERLVITQMDLIAYRNPSYHASLDDWAAYRRATRLALAAADRVVFFSEHARQDAMGEQLISSERSTIAGIGVDGDTPGDEAAPLRPPGIAEGTRFLLMLGSDYAHKNRQFAIRLFDELQTRHGFDGVLVFAGPHVPHGSSAELDRRVLEQRPPLRERVVDLGPVSEAEKQWLLGAAVAHLAPSLIEGFGLAPLEAAVANRPCIYAAWTAMAETIDRRAATVVPWDPVASARSVAPLLVAGAARDLHLSLLSEARARHTWGAVIPRLVGAYEAAIASPYRGSAPRVAAELAREQLLISLHRHSEAVDERARELDAHACAMGERVHELDAHAKALEARVVELDQIASDLRGRVRHGFPLIDMRAPLLTPAEQRGLLRITRRRWLKRPLLAPFRLLGSVRSTTKTPQGRDTDTTDAAP